MFGPLIFLKFSRQPILLMEPLVVDDKEHGNKLSAPAKILGWFRYPLE
jgi:hypothetical protein